MEWISNEGEDCQVGETFAKNLIQLSNVFKPIFVNISIMSDVFEPTLVNTWRPGRKEVMRLLLSETVETVGRLPRKPNSFERRERFGRWKNYDSFI